MKSKISNRKIAAIVLPAILAIAVFVALAPTASAATTYTVHPTDPGADFTTIQSAIDAAPIGDSIEVWNSTYYEHVTVNKRLNIYSRDGADVTIIDGNDSGKCFYVTASEVSISGFRVENGDYGIYLSSSNKNKIAEIEARLNKNDGIYLRSSSENEIVNCTVKSNDGQGIYLDTSCSSNKLIGNEISLNKGNGIRAYYSSHK